MKRLFIATKISLDQNFLQLKEQLKRELCHDEITWVKEDVCHLTLRFLGSTPDSKIPAIKKSLALACQQTSPFYLNLNKLGAFGSRYKPEVLWLGFEDFQPYKQLFDLLEAQLLHHEFAPAYGNFVPHITLGRVKKVIHKPRFWQSVEKLKPTYQQCFHITEMTLYQSFLHKEGPEYKPLASYAFSKEQ